MDVRRSCPSSGSGKGRAQGGAQKLELFRQVKNSDRVHTKLPFQIYLEVLFILLARLVFLLR